ncbi:formyl transferase [Spirochaetia bacterium]|nr:formyl transferase [Spirochaetia bacterium]
MENIKIVFIGGLSNGAIVCNYLQNNKHVDLQLIITYPDTFTYPRMEIINGQNIIKTSEANTQLENIRQLKPDYIFVAGWSELLSEELLIIPTKGTIGFHPSKLPFNRGRSVVAWQIEDGYEETALTMFYYNNIPDNGDIIAQELIPIEKNDYCNDVLEKIDKAIYNLMYAYFPLIRLGKAPRKEQILEEGNFRRLRKKSDSQIEWNQNSEKIYNKIRAISKPYPGAETILNNQKMKIWKADILHDFPFGKDLSPGNLIASLHDKTMIVKTKDGFIHILEYDNL